MSLAAARGLNQQWQQQFAEGSARYTLVDYENRLIPEKSNFRYGIYQDDFWVIISQTLLDATTL
jgi:hypothetical protein